MKKINKLLLVMVLGGSLAACSPAQEEKEPEHVHAANNSSVTWAWTDDYAATATVKCAECGEVIGTLPGTVTSKTDKAPSCTEDGSKTYTATVSYEGLTFTGTKQQILTASGHQINETLIPQVDPTCEKAGIIAHYECDTCGEYFVKEGDNYVVADSLEISALGHDYGTLIPQVDAKCGQDGVKAHYECSRCEKLFDEDHKLVTAEQLVIARPSDHEFEGYVSVDDDNHKQICSNCGDEVVSAHNYDYEQIVGENKHKAVCSDCEHELAAVDCTFEWHDNDYSCVCGREAEISVPTKINLDLVINDGVLEMGPNATPFVVTGAGDGSVITDVKKNGVTVWDADNGRFDDSILTVWDKATLDVEISNGTNTKEFKGFEVQFVSKSISTEAELKSMATIANAIAGKEKRYTGYFELASDITLTKVEPDNANEPYTWGSEHCMDCLETSGTVTEPNSKLNGFSGILDGNFHTIYNLNTIRSSDNRSLARPFIMLLNEWGVVRNIAFHGCEISGYSKFSLIGYGNGTVENIYVAPKHLGLTNTAASQQLNIFFAGNRNQAWGSPTIKNAVIEFNGATDCEFDDEGSTVKGTTNSSYLFTSDYHGRMPITEDIVVLTTLTNVKNRIAYIDIANGHSSLGGRDALREKYESVRGGKDQFFLKAEDVGVVPLDIVTAASRGNVYDEKGAEWAEKWNALWPEGSKVAKFEESVKELTLTKGKTEGAAIDNIVKVDAVPTGTAKVQYSIDDGSNWTDVANNKVDFTTFNNVTSIKFQALDSSETKLDEKTVTIDKTYYIAGDAWMKESSSCIGINNDLGGGSYNNGASSATYWKAENPGQPSEVIKYNAPATKQSTKPTFHAAARLPYVNGGKKSSADGKVPGSTLRMWINIDGFDYRLPANSAANIPFGIKKVALWAYFTNFVVTFEDDSTADISKIYNKGFFMTPLVGTGSSNAITGYMQSAAPYEVIEDGVEAKTWTQFVYDVTDWTSANYTSFTTNYFQFTQSITLGTLTGEATDMSTALYGATYNGKVVKDFKFDVAMNAVQFVY